MSKNKYGCTMSFIFIKKNFLIIIIMLVHNFCLLFSNSNVMWNACVKETKVGKCLEKCYEELGCIKLTPEWTHYMYRPYNLLPSSRHAINTIFVLWTYRSETVKPTIIGPCCCNNSEMAGHLIVLIHDFTSNGYAGWVQHLALGILSTVANKAPISVVSVDWSAGAEPPYALALANARVVALEIINFFKRLKTLGNIDMTKVHIIGHGVGAHIAGYVGKCVHIHKITGLDPSGPHFKGMPPNVKLYMDDATFVEVLHTNSLSSGQGNEELMGHVDFFANGGKLQPGCKECITPFITKLSRGDLKLGENVAGCSHKRSVKYYMESLFNPSCSYMGMACTSYKDFIEGRCLDCGENNELCFSLHPLSQPRNLNNSIGFFFVTSTSPPFCTEILHVTLNLRMETSKLKGSFNVTVRQDFGDTSFLLNDKGGRLIRTSKMQTEFTFLVLRTTPPVLNIPAKSIHISWHCKHVLYQLPKPPRVNSITIHKISDSKNKQVQMFCASTGGINLNPADINNSPSLKHYKNRCAELNQHKPMTP